MNMQKMLLVVFVAGWPLKFRRSKSMRDWLDQGFCFYENEKKDNKIKKNLTINDGVVYICTYVYIDVYEYINTHMHMCAKK